MDSKRGAGEYILTGINVYDSMNISYYSLMKGHCVLCNKPMKMHELFPPNREPNAICPKCYKNLLGDFTINCLVCGEYLEGWQIDNQVVSPTDISPRVHQLCLWYFKVCCRKVLGDDMSDVKDKDYYMNQIFGDATEFEHNQASDQMPNQVHISSGNSHTPLLGSGQPALPSPVQQGYVPKKRGR